MISRWRSIDILRYWAGVDENPERRSSTCMLVENIHLDWIDPKLLSTTVADSGLVSKDQLLEAYKKQALGSSKQRSRAGFCLKDITQTIEYVEERDKLETLMRFLLTIEEGLILVFVENKHTCAYVEDVLCHRGFPACSIHGDKSQREREEVLCAFKRAITPVLVATDAGTHGLYFPIVTQVINYDLPTNIDDYLHRIGKAGRAGGGCLSIRQQQQLWYHARAPRSFG